MIERKLHSNPAKCIISYMILIFISNCTCIYSQEAGKVQQAIDSVKFLSLDDCVNIALENNHKIKAQKQGILLSETKKKQAESAYWPQVSARAVYSYFDRDPIFSLPEFQVNVPQINLQNMSVAIPPFNVPQKDFKLMDKQNIQAFIDISLLVYTGGKITSMNKQAAIGIEIAKQDYRKSSLETRYDISRYFYGALLTRKIYKIAVETLERLEATLKLTQSLYENGSGKITKLDYLKNKVVVDQVKTMVTEIKKNVSLSKDALAFTMGTNSNFELPDVELPSIGENVLPENSETPGFWENPDWLKVDAALLLYKAKIDEAKSGYLPQVAITGGFTKNVNSFKAGLTNEFNNQLWIIGLGAEIPIFNGFRTSNEVNEAKIQLNKMKEEKSLLQDGLILQVKEAIKKIEISKEKINDIQQARITAGENRSLTERAFNQDMAEAKDLIEAQVMESLMEIQYQKALYDYNEAVAYLKLLTGRDF